MKNVKHSSCHSKTGYYSIQQMEADYKLLLVKLQGGRYFRHIASQVNLLKGFM